jgi:predicted alpha/beta superfamily hydrolase
MSASKVQHLPVPVAYSQLELLHSDIVGQDYQVKIRLPEEYANTTDPYPVL